MVVKIEEYNNSFEYQETIIVDIKTSSSTNQPFWRSIYEVLNNSYFEAVTFFQKHF